MGNNGLPAVIQKNDYYPFGLPMQERTDNATNKNRYLYNSKELLPDVNLNWYDYGARIYDPQLGRFHCMDPMSEANQKHSLYAYCRNNPVKFIDIGGKFTFDPKQLDRIKHDYPRAYGYIMELDKNKPGILQLAFDEVITNAMIKSTREFTFNNPNSPYYGTQEQILASCMTLTKEEIQKSFTPGEKTPVIHCVTQKEALKQYPTDGGPTGWNYANDGTNYSGPMNIQEKCFIALQNAKNYDELKVALFNFISVVIDEYLEYFGQNKYEINGELVGGIDEAKEIIMKRIDEKKIVDSIIRKPEQNESEKEGLFIIWDPIQSSAYK